MPESYATVKLWYHVSSLHAAPKSVHALRLVYSLSFNAYVQHLFQNADNAYS